MFWRKGRKKLSPRWLIGVTLLFILIGAAIAVYVIKSQPTSHRIATLGEQTTPTPGCSMCTCGSGHPRYVYFTLKQPDGCVLARAPRGTSGQPLGNHQPIAHFRNDLGLSESDTHSSITVTPQLSLH